MACVCVALFCVLISRTSTECTKVECVVRADSQSSTRYHFSVMWPFHHLHVPVLNITLNLKRAECGFIVTDDPGTNSFTVALIPT